VSLNLPDDEQWSHAYLVANKYTHLDHIFISPALYALNRDIKPEINRKGLAYRAKRYLGERYPRVGLSRPAASDHCPIAVRLKLS
jgi:hypothetical protein